jgi:hypothetical protein
MDGKSSSIKTLVIGIILLLINLFPTGCAKTHYKHYEGSSLPDSELALLKASKQIHSIDGHSYKYGIGGKDFAKALTTGLFSEDLGRTYWQIIPGKHEIALLVGPSKVTYYGETYVVPKTTFFSIEVDKGHTYKIDRKNAWNNPKYFGHITSVYPTREEQEDYIKKTGKLIFFLIDVCCPSHAPVPLDYGKVNRIEK